MISPTDDCYNSHSHEINEVGVKEPNDPTAEMQEERERSVQRCAQGLAHATQCRDDGCQLPICLKMKRIMQHLDLCQRKARGGCPICTQFNAMKLRSVVPEMAAEPAGI